MTGTAADLPHPVIDQTKPASVPSSFAAKWLDITITLAYRMPYDKEIEENDNVISIRGKKTAL